MSARAMSVLRGTARSSGVLVAFGYGALVLSHVLEPHSGPPSQLREWLGIALLSTACLTPLLAWRWELPGAVVSLAALVSFVALIRINEPWGLAVVAVIAMPGVLHLLDWLARRLFPTTRVS